MIEHKYPIEVRPGDLRPWLDPRSVRQIVPLPGWHNSIFRVDAKDGGRFVLRVHVPDEPLEYIQPTLRIVDVCSRHLPYVPAPIHTRAGLARSDLHGRVATLWPFVDGVASESVDDRQRSAAAGVLAEIHGVGAQLTDEDAVQPTWSFAAMDWRSNRRWNMPRLVRFLKEPRAELPGWFEPAALIDELELASREVQAGLAAIPGAAFPTSVAHGDFYPANLLFDKSGNISAVLDWDDARLDWTGWDIANALLEFCAGPAGLDLDITLCDEFIGDYLAVGEGLTAEGRLALPLLVKARKLDEVVYSLDQMTQLLQVDWAYLKSSLTAWRKVQSLERI